VHPFCNLQRRVRTHAVLQLYKLSSRVAPDTTDADVHALCTKPAALKMKESGKSSKNHRTVRGTTETCKHQVNERSV
jgi:hypothetical protein